MSKEKFKKLKSMDCYDEVEFLIKSGHSIPKVASLIQDFWEEYTDVKKSSLETTLRRFKGQEISDIDKLASGEADRLDEALDKVEGQVNVIEELEKLLKFQKKRININYKNEQEAGTLLKHTNNEVETAANLVDMIAQYQQDFGLTPRNLGTLKIEGSINSAGSEYGKGASEAIESDKDQRQMIEFLENLGEESGNIDEILEDESEDEDKEEVIDAEYETVKEKEN